MTMETRTTAKTKNAAQNWLCVIYARCKTAFFIFIHIYFPSLSPSLSQPVCVCASHLRSAVHTFCFLYFDFSGTRFLRVYHSAYYYSQDKKLVPFVIHLLPLCVYIRHTESTVAVPLAAHCRCHIFISAIACVLERRRVLRVAAAAAGGVTSSNDILCPL